MVMPHPSQDIRDRLVPEPGDPPSGFQPLTRGRASCRAGAEACSLQKLFAVEEEFEDEDFLSAVEDAENQFAGSLPVNAGCLRPVSSKPQATVQGQSSRWLPSHPTAPSKTSGLCLPSSGMSMAVRGPPSTGAPPLRPVLTSSSWTSHQRRVMLTEVPREPARPQSLAPCPVSTLESPHQVFDGLEGPEQDEFDKVLASMELEGPGMGLDLGVSSEITGTLPTWQGEDPVLAKKARVAELRGSCPKGPTPATRARHHGFVSVQGQPLDPAVHCRTPQHHLRPVTSGNLPIPTASIGATQQCHWGVCAKDPPLQAPQPVQAASGLVQCSPQNRFSRQSFQSPGAQLSGKPRFPGRQTPNSGCSTLSRAPSGFCPQGLLEPQTLVAPAESPVGTPKGLHSSLAPQAALQMPVVTNHLVQLVSAASRTPHPPTHTATQAKARRFPGPAGLLPHQHNGKNLEEIMVSTPQTPTHGAVAKFRTEVVAGSQSSAEDDFGRGPWLTMKSALGLDERDPTCFLCTYSIIMVLRKAALKQLPRNKVPNMAVMIKSLTRSTMDASVVFKDPTGEMQGTVHRVLLETHQNELKPGSVLLLKQIGVFSPSLRNHYLNVTPNNLVDIYSPDSGDGNFLKPSQPFPKDPGSIHGHLQRDVDVKSEEDPRTAQNPGARVFPKELSEADDLDGLLSELPEDFFSGTSSWDCPKAGPPP
ncbi:homologous recombination OB-fold protein [Orycteropus afer afer]|uniref:Homologous recombination OB-fold protein n=1 Tax=Orycteropus afer afer TaxID=1230840 RepID=A0AC54ZE17_ORYAF|nr:homologous recombination OB-fold protein [Orycteropus afer afer]